jgi:hypothetical protein
MAVPAGHAAGESFPVGEQEDQPRFGAAAQQHVTVSAPQRGACHDRGLARRDPFVHPGGDRLQPRPAVGVGKRLSPPHLLDVGRGVERIGVNERPVQASREQRPDGGLAATGRPGDYQDHFLSLPGCRRRLRGLAGLGARAGHYQPPRWGQRVPPVAPPRGSPARGSAFPWLAPPRGSRGSFAAAVAVCPGRAGPARAGRATDAAWGV